MLLGAERWGTSSVTAPPSLTSSLSVSEPAGSGRRSAGGSPRCAIRTDESLWCWGYSRHGQLGLGDCTSRDSTARVGSARWLSVTAAGDHLCGIQVNHMLWYWGYNYFGHVG